MYESETFMNEEHLWVEKYRPHSITDCILPSRLKKVFQSMVDTSEVQNMILSGGPGTGKTTVARAICEDLGVNYLLINSSEDRGIEMLRTKVRNYASSMSFDGGYKIIIMDEADGITAEAQKAFRGALEEFSSNCKFILTCNYKSKLIDAIHSRSTVIDFSLEKDERIEMAGMFFKRLQHILTTEGITYDKKVLATVVHKFFPDYRRTINELQRYCVDEKSLTTQSLSQMNNVKNMDDLFAALKTKDFRSMRGWVASNIDNDPTDLFRTIFDNLSKYTKPESVPICCLILAKYQYQSGMVADQEINLTACLTEFLVECEFK